MRTASSSPPPPLSRSGDGPTPPKFPRLLVPPGIDDKVVTLVYERIARVRQDYGVEMNQTDVDKLAWLSYSCEWTRDPVWLAHATQLDSSGLYYFLPDRFECLSKMTDKRDYGYVRIVLGKVEIYAVGVHGTLHQPLGPFFDESMMANYAKHATTFGVSALTEMRFALALQKDLDQGPVTHLLWETAYRESVDYFDKHRALILALSPVLDHGQRDVGHDVTKVRLYHVALGRLFHWPVDHTLRAKRFGREDEQNAISDLCRDMIKHCHTSLENHHPEYSGGPVDYRKMFVDR